MMVTIMQNNRDYKNFTKGEYYHIYNRGNNKMKIFIDSEDYDFFMLRLNQNLSKIPISEKTRGYAIKNLPTDAFELECFCLMSNHFHLLLKQNTDLPLSKLILKVCTSYSKYFNKKYNRVGSLFQDEFKAVHITSHGQLMGTIDYIHQNPIKEGLVFYPEDYLYLHDGHHLANLLG